MSKRRTTSQRPRGAWGLQTQACNVLAGQLAALMGEEAGVRRALVHVYSALTECQARAQIFAHVPSLNSPRGPVGSNMVIPDFLQKVLRFRKLQ